MGPRIPKSIPDTKAVGLACSTCKRGDVHLRFRDKLILCKDCGEAEYGRNWWHWTDLRYSDEERSREQIGVPKKQARHVNRPAPQEYTTAHRGKDGYAMDSECRVFKDGKQLGVYAEPCRMLMDGKTYNGLSYFNVAVGKRVEIGPLSQADVDGLYCDSIEVKQD